MQSFFFIFAKNVLRTRLALDVRKRVETVLTRNNVITSTESVPSDVIPVCMESNVTKVFYDVYYYQIHLCFIFKKWIVLFRCSFITVCIQIE